MKAIAYVPEVDDLRLVDRPEPNIDAPDDVKVKILRVGICGTDREKLAEGEIKTQPGYNDIVIGHEVFGQAVAVGPEVKEIAPGDYVAIAIRRGCGKCGPCSMDRPDMCATGEYKDRGLAGLDGFQTEYVVDKEKYMVRVPREIGPLGVLTEPLSVVEKALEEVQKLQFERIPDADASPDWFFGRKCLVAGLGAIGLLAALALRLRGAEVYGLDIVGKDTVRPKWLERIGGQYIDGREVKPDHVDESIGGHVDVIFEASGVANLAFNLLDALAKNGIYVLTGLPMGESSIQIPGPELMSRMVRCNQLLVGSVSSTPSHFRMAVRDLLLAYSQSDGQLAALITHRYDKTDFKAFKAHPADEIKAVIEWAA